MISHHVNCKSNTLDLEFSNAALYPGINVHAGLPAGRASMFVISYDAMNRIKRTVTSVRLRRRTPVRNGSNGETSLPDFHALDV